MPAELPIPPLEMRELVGLTDLALYGNPSGAPIFDGLPTAAWRSYLDFGCGCGRSARRLIQQDPRPERYVGIDLHRGMVQWCRQNLAPHAPGFEFIHHDVYNPGLNPNASRPWATQLPVEDGSITLMEAHSVFTHLIESQAEFYLDEVARVLAPDGIMVATFFLFDKVEFPFMQDSQNAVYINDRDPTNAVVFDRGWLMAGLAERGLALVRADVPAIRGFHWQLRIAPAGHEAGPVELPIDTSAPGRLPPPLLRERAHEIGLDGTTTAAPVYQTARQELPPPNPRAAELAAAKDHIASLEERLATARHELEEMCRLVDAKPRWWRAKRT